MSNGWIKTFETNSFLKVRNRRDKKYLIVEVNTSTMNVTPTITSVAYFLIVSESRCQIVID